MRNHYISSQSQQGEHAYSLNVHMILLLAVPHSATLRSDQDGHAGVNWKWINCCIEPHLSALFCHTKLTVIPWTDTCNSNMYMYPSMHCTSQMILLPLFCITVSILHVTKSEDHHCQSVLKHSTKFWDVLIRQHAQNIDRLTSWLTLRGKHPFRTM